MALARPVVVVLQPGYLPWLGFFDQMCRADVFVYYDDVQYDTHGWRNRNRIKTQQGPLWLTVPVRHSGLGSPRILDVEIDNRTGWARKHVASIQQAYARAPHAERWVPVIAEVLCQGWTHLVELDITLAEAMAQMFGLSPRIERASRLQVDGERSERLVGICQHFGAATYLSGNAAKSYLDVTLFERHGIEVAWQDYVHPEYAQQHGEFVPFLSALDALLNCGTASRSLIGSTTPQPAGATGGDQPS